MPPPFHVHVCFYIFIYLSYTDSHCKSREFQCIEGTCISNELHCNGVMDCTDSSDEFLCRTLNQLYTHIYIHVCTCTCVCYYGIMYMYMYECITYMLELHMYIILCTCTCTC